MAQNVGKRGQTGSVQGPNPNSGEPWVSSQYSWHSFPQPSDQSDNTVITVHSASFNEGPPIPLDPVKAKEEGEQSASTKSAVPWQLVRCWVPKPEPESEVLVEPVSQWGQIKVVHANEEEQPPMPPLSATDRRFARRCAAFGRAMQDHQSPTKFTVSQISKQVVGQLQTDRRWSGSQWLEKANMMSDIFIPTKDSVLYQSFHLESREILHRALKLYDKATLKTCLEAVRIVQQEQYNVSDSTRFMYRGNICKICDNCEGNTCHWNYSCKQCFLPQPVCFLKVRHKVLFSNSATPCYGCPACKHFVSHASNDLKRAACDRCHSAPQPVGTAQPIAHCAMHCNSRLSPLSQQPALEASKEKGNILKYCISCGQRHKAAECSRQATVHKLLNQRRRRKALLNIDWETKPKPKVTTFHSEADSNTLPHFKSGFPNQPWGYRQL